MSRYRLGKYRQKNHVKMDIKNVLFAFFLQLGKNKNVTFANKAGTPPKTDKN